MPSITERILKDGSRVYEIRVARGRDPVTGKPLTPYTTRYKPPEGWSAKKAMKRAQIEAAAFEARYQAGEVMTRAERKSYELEQIRAAEQAKREEALKITFSKFGKRYNFPGLHPHTSGILWRQLALQMVQML